MAGTDREANSSEASSSEDVDDADDAMLDEDGYLIDDPDDDGMPNVLQVDPMEYYDDPEIAIQLIALDKEDKDKSSKKKKSRDSAIQKKVQVILFSRKEKSKTPHLF